MASETREDGIVLAFDYGFARVGVAVGDSDTRNVQPLATVRSNRRGYPNWREVTVLVSVWRPMIVVIGRSERSMRPPLLRGIDAFAGGLRKRFPYLPQSFLPEDYTSTFAYSLLIENRCSRGRIRKGDVDKIAAGLILEDWLSARDAK